MCGIVGFNWDDSELSKKMTDSLIHRGPDDSGIFVDKEAGVSLGHRRLSIIDLSENGRQPMFYSEYILTFNGEIYNYEELRAELIDEGHQFKTSSDSEVILHAYEKWGVDCVNHFNGMWSFCIYDRKKNELFISRDRFGIKPLYYYWDSDKFIFASELKAISRHSLELEIDSKGLNFFFYQKYIGDKYTIFKNIFKLRPAENIIFDLNKNELKLSIYYSLENEVLKNKELSLKKRIKSIEALLKDAVDKRLISDVPVGSFLSGGLDSSLISAFISENVSSFKTFSIGFKVKSYDELRYSKLVAKDLQTDHYYEYQDIKEEDIKYLLENMDEPFGDYSVIPSYLLSKITREKVTVSLSGDSGDEVFGGYDTYKAYKISKAMPQFVAKILKKLILFFPDSDKKVNLIFKVKRFVRSLGRDVIKRHFDWLATFIESEREKLLGNHFIKDTELIRFDGDDSLLSIQLKDISNYMAEDILKKVDMASMLNSLEVRVPFLDYRIVPLVLSLPDKYKIRYFKTKYLLKKIAEPYLPNNIVHRKKRGFTVPISIWLRKSEFMKSFLLNEKYYSHNFFKKSYVEEMYFQHLNRKQDRGRELWLLFIFNYWFYKFHTTKESVR